MELSQIIAQIHESLSRGEFICLFCHCAVTYSGRAESYLDFGDRLIMIKQDRSVLIHQPDGGNPINYLRPPAQISFTLEHGQENEYILFKASCQEDEIDVEIPLVHDFFSKRLEDGQKQDLSGNEAEMSDMLKNNPKLVRPDFKPLSREEHTKYGFIDVFGHLGDGTLAIVECKRYTAGLAAVTQLRRYVEKIKADKGIDNVIGIMAAPAVTANAFEMLTDWGFSYARIEPPKRNVRGKKRQKKIDHFF